MRGLDLTSHSLTPPLGQQNSLFKIYPVGAIRRLTAMFSVTCICVSLVFLFWWIQFIVVISLSGSISNSIFLIAIIHPSTSSIPSLFHGQTLREFFFFFYDAQNLFLITYLTAAYIDLHLKFSRQETSVHTYINGYVNKSPSPQLVPPPISTALAATCRNIFKRSSAQ